MYIGTLPVPVTTQDRLMVGARGVLGEALLLGGLGGIATALLLLHLTRKR